MDRDTVATVLEAILLTGRGPISSLACVEAVGEPDVTQETVEQTLDAMRQRWEEEGRGIRLERVAGGWRCVTPPELDPYLRAFHGIIARQRLSQAGLEVLAIVAHRQPVTLPEISFIRATNSSGVVRTLLDRGLLRVTGRKQVVGRPFLYRTSKEFLTHFGLERPEDLPDPEELVADDAAGVPLPVRD